ncbi:3-keto-disaccharide hydrolase [Hymenobacter sp. HD11105]
MRKYITLVLGATLLFISTSSTAPRGWEPLLDKQLSKWRTFQSYRHQVDYKGKQPTDAQGKEIAPLGYDKNEANVFSVVLQEGEPVLRISGEIYGCVFTKQDFTNYALKLKVKWGEKKWVPRIDEPRDSGILYNSQGECGVDYWHSWMLSQEFQVSEYAKGKAMGDFWCIANSTADIRATPNETKDGLKYDPTAVPVTFGRGGPGFCQASANNGVPRGQWDELELIHVNGKSVHIVNGRVVLAVNNSGYSEDGQRLPLTHGKIQLQSEAAEVYYKGIMIKPLDAMPAEYAKYFSDQPSK